MATHAAMLMLHLPSEKMNDLLEMLDGRLAPRCGEHPGFRGLLCLESGEALGRSQVFVVSLWDNATFEEIEDAAEQLANDASEFLGVGVARQSCWILRDMPGHSANTVSP
jgi:heme-degrading monooxygenase HmoA